MRSLFYGNFKPRFFSIARSLVYVVGLIMMLGIYTRIDNSEFVFINFVIYCVVVLLLVVFDVVNGLKKIKSYKNHLVQFHDNYILFVDQRGSFELPYEQIKSYQFSSDQILIRINGNRFLISGTLHGISFEELKEMVNFLASKNIVSKVSRGFLLFLGMFLIINYGSDYLFIEVLELSSDASLFGTLYICLVVGVGYFVWDRINMRKLKTKEE